MSWIVFIDGKAQKYLTRIPTHDSDRIRVILRDMANNPFYGDAEKMEGFENAWRRRVGAYRIQYEIRKNKNLIYVFDIQRRTSSTY